MIRLWRFKFLSKKPASFFAFERSERQRRNDSKQTRNAKLTLFILICTLTACEQYREPKANCFNLVSRGPTSADCTFEPLGGPEAMDEVYE